jgi:hypothetical protein
MDKKAVSREHSAKQNAGKLSCHNGGTFFGNLKDYGP